MKSVFMGRLFRKLLFGLAGLGFLMIFVTTTPLVTWWAKWLSGPFEDPTGDTLIVLGATVMDNETIGASSYWRSVYGVRAYRQGGFRRVLVSGGPDAEGHIISVPMLEFLACEGVPRQAILAENRSTSTRQNALFTREMLRDVPGRKVLLTSDYHMYRATRVFRKAGLEVVPRPCPDVIKRGKDWKERWPAFVDLVTETCKIVYYQARGWI